jgi:hypothetical protein
VPRLRIVEVYLHSPIRVHGLKLNSLKPRDNSTFYMLFISRNQRNFVSVWNLTSNFEEKTKIGDFWKQREKEVLYLVGLLHGLYFFLVLLILRPWKWSQYVPQKHLLTFTRIHSVICLKRELFIVTVLRASNPAKWQGGRWTQRMGVTGEQKMFQDKEFYSLFRTCAKPNLSVWGVKEIEGAQKMT